MQINFDCGYLSQRYYDESKGRSGELRPQLQEARKLADPAARAAAVDKIHDGDRLPS